MNPLHLIAELTHRCPLRCAYCSNPQELAAKASELSTETWLRVMHEARALGVLHVSFTGGEPCLRSDLVELVAGARKLGLYVNLITSGVGLNPSLLGGLKTSGLDHVQLSFQDVDKEGARKITGVNALEKKREVAALIGKSGIAFTVNLVVHRYNLERLPRMIDEALGFGATKIEVAHVVYNGWALKNQRALLPSRDQVRESERVIAHTRERLRGRARIEFVLPDVYAQTPKACMGGWGRRTLLIDPVGQVLPCHSAATIQGVRIPNVAGEDLASVWRESELFSLFRGYEWMPEVCRTCDHRERDFGGCRCQALALTGDARQADPVCHQSPNRGLVDGKILSAQRGSTVLEHRPVHL